jgi:hypothetical protein
MKSKAYCMISTHVKKFFLTNLKDGLVEKPAETKTAFLAS